MALMGRVTGVICDHLTVRPCYQAGAFVALMGRVAGVNYLPTNRLTNGD